MPTIQSEPRRYDLTCERVSEAIIVTYGNQSSTGSYFSTPACLKTEVMDNLGKFAFISWAGDTGVVSFDDVLFPCLRKQHRLYLYKWWNKEPVESKWKALKKK